MLQIYICIICYLEIYVNEVLLLIFVNELVVHVMNF